MPTKRNTTKRKWQNREKIMPMIETLNDKKKQLAHDMLHRFKVAQADKLAELEDKKVDLEKAIRSHFSQLMIAIPTPIAQARIGSLLNYGAQFDFGYQDDEEDKQGYGKLIGTIMIAKSFMSSMAQNNTNLEMSSSMASSLRARQAFNDVSSIANTGSNRKINQHTTDSASKARGLVKAFTPLAINNSNHHNILKVNSSLKNGVVSSIQVMNVSTHSNRPAMNISVSKLASSNRVLRSTIKHKNGSAVKAKKGLAHGTGFEKSSETPEFVAQVEQTKSAKEELDGDSMEKERDMKYEEGSESGLDGLELKQMIDTKLFNSPSPYVNLAVKPMNNKQPRKPNSDREVVLCSINGTPLSVDDEWVKIHVKTAPSIKH